VTTAARGFFVRLVPAIATISALAAIPLVGISVWSSIRAGDAAASAEALVSRHQRAGYAAERVRAAVLDCRRYEQGMLLASGSPQSRDEHLGGFLHMVRMLDEALDEYLALSQTPNDPLQDEYTTVTDYRSQVLSEWARLIAYRGEYTAWAADVHLEPWKERMRDFAKSASDCGAFHASEADKKLVALAGQLRHDQATAIGAGVLSFALLAFGMATLIVPTARRARRLAEVASLLSHGDRRVDCRVSGNDEIAIAGDALNRMRILIREREIELGRRVAESRELAAALARSPFSTHITDRDGLVVWSNRSGGERGGTPLDGILRQSGYEDRGVRDALQALAQGQPFAAERGAVDQDGVRTWFQLDGYPIRDERAAVVNYVVIERDISDSRRAETAREGNVRVAAMLVGTAPLADVLGVFARQIEESFPGVLVSILRLDGDRLRHVVAPTLPVAYTRLLDGLQIGPDVGSCGSAAYLGTPTIVRDVQTHPNWARYRGIAEAFGLRACWSVPCKDPSGEVLGTLAAYARVTRDPTTAERQTLEIAANIISLAFARHRAEQRHAMRALELNEAQRELDCLRRDTIAIGQARDERIGAALRECREALQCAMRRDVDDRLLADLARTVDDVAGSLASGSPAGDDRPVGVHTWRDPAVTIRRVVTHLVEPMLTDASGPRALSPTDAGGPIRLSLVAEGAEALPDLALCDHERLRRALGHLLRAGLDSSVGGPCLVVAACARREQEATLRITVRDRGFDRLESGCALPRLIVERDGGALRVHREGLERVIHLTLPCATVESASVGGSDAILAPPRVDEPGGSLNGRVLLVDDHGDNRALFALNLRRMGLTVEEAANGDQAMSAILVREGREPLDLVVLDMQLPGIDGYGVARAVRAAGQRVPIIATTAHGMQGERERCLAAGCDEVALKPISREDLIAVVHRVMRRAEQPRAFAGSVPSQ
jgi:CheY-like chemotaxis protein/PAS domain-containing protein